MFDGEFAAEGEGAVTAAVAEGADRGPLDEHRAVERQLAHAFADGGEFERCLHALPELLGERLAVSGHRKGEAFGYGFEAEAGHDGFIFAAAHPDRTTDEFADVEGAVGDGEFGARLGGPAVGHALADGQLNRLDGNHLAGEAQVEGRDDVFAFLFRSDAGVVDGGLVGI